MFICREERLLREVLGVKAVFHERIADRVNQIFVFFDIGIEYLCVDEASPAFCFDIYYNEAFLNSSSTRFNLFLIFFPIPAESIQTRANEPVFCAFGGINRTAKKIGNHAIKSPCHKTGGFAEPQFLSHGRIERRKTLSKNETAAGFKRKSLFAFGFPASFTGTGRDQWIGKRIIPESMQ